MADAFVTTYTIRSFFPFLEENNTNQLSSSILWVPSVLKDVSPADSYTPGVVSIGPLHYENPNIRQELKGTYMRNLLQLLGSSREEALVSCFNKVNESMHKIRACYAGISARTNMNLAKIMVMDGCFILGFLYSLKEQNETSIHYQHGKREEKDLVTVNILKDLLLLENQIPFFVLQDIFECTILKSKQGTSLIEHIKPLLEFGHHCLFIGDLKIPHDLTDTTHHDHILGLLHICYHHKPTFPISSGTLKTHSVIELEKAGVSFRPNGDVSWPMAIRITYLRRFPWFWVKPTLNIPILNIHVGTKVFLQNIIAYEQVSKVDRYFTSFVTAIHDLVDTGDDVATLVKSKVIINHLKSNDEAANIINKICKNVIVRNFYSMEWNELDAYYNQRVTLVRRAYFNNRWNSINLFVGIIMFFLSAIQIYFAINPRKQ